MTEPGDSERTRAVVVDDPTTHTGLDRLIDRYTEERYEPLGFYDMHQVEAACAELGIDLN